MSAGEHITPEMVMALDKPTSHYLCPLEANTYGIEFIYFKIRDVKENQVLCEISKRPEDIGKPLTDAHRKIRYQFGPYFFQLDMIGTTLRFKVANAPLKDFVMIERHYFKDKLIKSYKFESPFCMPNSVNEMEAIYEMPELSQEEQEEMIKCPWETVSDSFYFVGGKLIMHTKAEFSYAEFKDE